MNNQVKAIISDLDGTLLNNEHVVSPYSKQVLKTAVEAGYKVIIATGRPPVDLNGIVEDYIGIPAYRVCSNGARTYSPKGELMRSFDLPEDFNHEILTRKYDDDVFVHLYQDDKWFCNRQDDFSAEHFSMTGFLFTVADFNKMKGLSGFKIFFTCHDHEKLLAIEQKIKSKAREEFYYTYSNPFCFEILNPQANKANAISYILQQEGIGWDQTVAFGDGLNDKEMLTESAHGFLMANASVELKKALPSYDSIGLNKDDSVAKFIEQHLL